MAEHVRAATVHDRVVRTIAHFLGYAEDAVADDKKLVELDPAHNSLSDVELVMEFEDEFGIEITDDDAEKLSKMTVGEMVAWFDRFLEGRTA